MRTDGAAYTWETARRAGIRRSLARLRRIASLGLINPRLGTRLYPLRPLTSLPNGSRIPLPISRPGEEEWTGSISLLNTEPFSVMPPVAWDANPTGHALWAYELHQFEWAWPLVRLVDAGDRPSLRMLADLLADYVERVRFGAGPAWEPHPLSRRLAVWSAAWSVLRHSAYDLERLSKVAAEIDRAARYLARNVEHDLDNNHVIANARALAFAGTLLGEGGPARRYGQVGYALMWDQLRKQVLPDGGHIEGAPHYHFQVWRDAIDTVLLAQANHFDVPPDIADTLCRMRDWLLGLRRPDGTFPLLGDSVADDPEELHAVLRVADRFGPGSGEERRGLEKMQAVRRAQILPDSGYAVLHADQTWSLFDAGPFGARHCPGHGHSDALSFELWAEGQPLIVDPGVFQYEPGPLRDYFRSTAAHSTLVVDGENQTEMASSFRVGRMATANLLPEQTEGLPLIVRGVHDGYARLRQPVFHRRTLVLHHPRKLTLQDEIEGRGEHDFDVTFHLAPCRGASVERDGFVASYDEGLTMRVSFDAPPSAERVVTEGWYSPTWYTRQATPVLRLRWRGQAPCRIATTITIAQEVA